MSASATRGMGHWTPPDRVPPLAPGRYCLAVCYCRQCPHYEPLPPIRRRTAIAASNRPNNAWETRDEPTWLDR